MRDPENSKPKFSPILDEDHDVLVLLRNIFIGKGSYSVDDLADKVSLSSDSIYKQFEAVRVLRADVFIFALMYDVRKRGVESKLLKYLNRLLGLDSRPAKVHPKVRIAVQSIEQLLLDLFQETETKGADHA
jgi:hypothetical protein